MNVLSQALHISARVTEKGGWRVQVPAGPVQVTDGSEATGGRGGGSGGANVGRTAQMDYVLFFHKYKKRSEGGRGKRVEGFGRGFGVTCEHSLTHKVEVFHLNFIFQTLGWGGR